MSILATTHTAARRGVLSLLCVLSLLLSGCTFFSTARDWSHLTARDGNPVYLKSGTNIGFNVGIFIPIPFLGSTSLGPMIRDVTQSIANENGDGVQVIESRAENYWYGFPPFTWIITPVITTVRMQYRPGTEAWAKSEADLIERGR